MAALDEPTFVYVIAYTDLVKIGVSRNPAARLKGLSTGMPEEPYLVAARQVPNRKLAFALELRLHRLFARNRARREWFRVTAAHAARALKTVNFEGDGHDSEKIIAAAFAAGRNSMAL